jgi:hypothetical protein
MKRIIAASACVAAAITGIAACGGGSQPAHHKAAPSASASASSTLDMTGVPVITKDTNGNYSAVVTQAPGDATVMDALKRVCSQDQPQLMQRLEQAGAPARQLVIVDLHGPGQMTGTTNSYALAARDFAVLNSNEGLCGVGP